MSRHHYMSEDLDLLESGLYSDATITCGERTWKVHKNIIRRCEWFKKAFNGKFKEAQTNNVSISVEDFPPELVDCVITYIYSGVVSNIEKIDTNGSLVDACIRLWAIADFLIMKDLEEKAVALLQKYCDEKVEQLCVVECYGTAMFLAPDGRSYETVLTQLFRGVETAYTKYPHSMPCQQVLVGFFHKTRATVFGSPEFHRCMSKASLKFSHELFMTTIGGRASNWSSNDSEFKNLRRNGTCTRCNNVFEAQGHGWVVDPSMRHGLFGNDWALTVDWCCISCSQKQGFEDVSLEEKKLLSIQNGLNGKGENSK